MSSAPNPEKLYYTIGEVSRLIGLPPSVLRYWETEFEGLKPPRRGGKRQYRRREIERLTEIKRLLYDQRFTIEGARKALKSGKTPPSKSRDDGKVDARVIEELRKGLKEILDLLE